MKNKQAEKGKESCGEGLEYNVVRGDLIEKVTSEQRLEEGERRSPKVHGRSGPGMLREWQKGQCS